MAFVFLVCQVGAVIPEVSVSGSCETGSGGRRVLSLNPRDWNQSGRLALLPGRLTDASVKNDVFRICLSMRCIWELIFRLETRRHGLRMENWDLAPSADLDWKGGTQDLMRKNRFRWLRDRENGGTSEAGKTLSEHYWAWSDGWEGLNGSMAKSFRTSRPLVF